MDVDREQFLVNFSRHYPSEHAECPFHQTGLFEQRKTLHIITLLMTQYKQQQRSLKNINGMVLEMKRQLFLWCKNTGLFEMIVGVLTTCHTQYTSDSSICVCVFFYIIEQHSKLLLHTLKVLYMCTLCDSTDINTIIQFVPNCL